MKQVQMDDGSVLNAPHPDVESNPPEPMDEMSVAEDGWMPFANGPHADPALVKKLERVNAGGEWDEEGELISEEVSESVPAPSSPDTISLLDRLDDGEDGDELSAGALPAPVAAPDPEVIKLLDSMEESASDGAERGEDGRKRHRTPRATSAPSQ